MPTGRRPCPGDPCPVQSRQRYSVLRPFRPWCAAGARWYSVARVISCVQGFVPHMGLFQARPQGLSGVPYAGSVGLHHGDSAPNRSVILRTNCLERLLSSWPSTRVPIARCPPLHVAACNAGCFLAHMSSSSGLHCMSDLGAHGVRFEAGGTCLCRWIPWDIRASAVQVVELETISAEFGMRCNEVVAEIRHLEREGMLTGVLDDRGKVCPCPA